MNSQASFLYQQENAILPGTTDNPLHVAAALGLPNFAREIIERNPDLAIGFNESGLTPCHVAVTNGHVSVVKELLESNVGFDICCLKDNIGGFLPIHIAVMKGKLDMLEEVRSKCSLALLRESTREGDSILHLAVKFDSVAAFCHLSRLLHGDEELFNRRDAEGNTVLHLAVAKRQLQTVKMLVGRSRKTSRVEVNAVNQNGSTPLDLFYDLGIEHTDTTLEEVIKKAGGRRAVELDAHQPYNKKEIDQLELNRDPKIQPPEKIFTLHQMFASIKIAISRRACNDKDKEISNTLMVVATLIAAITFQSALNPPGGLIQQGEKEGQAVFESSLDDFLLFDMVAMISSLSVIMLTTYIVPKWKDLIKLANLLIWVSVCFTMWSFLNAIPLIFPRLSTIWWIDAISVLGDVVVQIFALYLLGRTWYFLHKRFSLFLHARSPEGIVVGSRRIALILIPLLGASLLWGPWLSLDLVSYFLPVVTYYPTFFSSTHASQQT